MGNQSNQSIQLINIMGRTKFHDIRKSLLNKGKNKLFSKSGSSSSKKKNDGSGTRSGSCDINDEGNSEVIDTTSGDKICFPKKEEDKEEDDGKMTSHSTDDDVDEKPSSLSKSATTTTQGNNDNDNDNDGDHDYD